MVFSLAKLCARALGMRTGSISHDDKEGSVYEQGVVRKIVHVRMWQVAISSLFAARALDRPCQVSRKSMTESEGTLPTSGLMHGRRAKTLVPRGACVSAARDDPGRPAMFSCMAVGPMLAE